jgi:PAS domain S-box-containing protein
LQFDTIKTPMRDTQGVLIGVLGISRDITAARAAQEALRLSEQRLQQTVRLAHIGIFDHDHLDDTLHWSAEHREIYGVGAAETVTLVSSLTHVLPTDLARVRAAIAQAHDPAGDGQMHAEYRIIRPYGEIGFLETRSQTLFGGEGNARRPLRTLGASLDITERKRAEALLRASEQRLAVTLQSIGDGVIATDLNGRVTQMNTVAERLTGWPLAAALGQALTDVFDIIDAASRQPFPSPAQRVLASGAIERLPDNTVLRGRDGREHHIADSIAPIRDASGCVTGVVLVFSDISAQYLVQQALVAHVQAQEIRDRALTHVSQGVMVTDAQLLIRYVNPYFESLTGYSAAETIGRSPSFLQGAAISSETLADIARALRSGQAFKGEILHERRDGVSNWIALDYAPMHDGRGALTGFVGTLRDITDQKQGEAERRSLETQLRESQKIEAIGTLAGGIAHDFNNILGAIMGNVALARDDLPPGHAALKSLEQIAKGGARARSLVQQILTFSRRQPHQLVHQPLRPLVEESLALLRATLPARVSLQLALTEAPLYLNADGTQIQQVVMNLCTNAWHALLDSIGCITVGLEEVVLDATAALAAGGLTSGRHAHLWVRDTGRGIDAATRARIFEPFFTTKPVGQGTGLGLAVVHGIVAAHQGAISVDSAPGEGATFHLYFPAREHLRAAAAPTLTPTPALTQPAALQGEGQHVLYVDDDEVMLLVVERLLQRAGFRVSCCQNASDALALVRAAPDAVDIVVTDFNMPTGSGLELAEALAQVRDDLPVVISSGSLSDELRSGAERLGVRHLLQKQDTAEELAGLLRRVLAQ